MNKEYYLTKEKYDELNEELDYLTNTRRNEIAKALEHAKSLGDLSENAEYQEARSNQAEVEGRIRELETIISYARIVSHRKSDKVEIWSMVSIKKKGSPKAALYTVVGSEESDLTKGYISYTSPLGSSLLGKKKGESIIVETPGGKSEYTIENVT